MPIVEIPGEGMVEFPDSMSDEEIGLAISRNRAGNINKPQEDLGFLPSIGSQIARNFAIGGANIGKAFPAIDAIGQAIGLPSSQQTGQEIKGAVGKPSTGGAFAGDLLTGLLSSRIPGAASKFGQAAVGGALGAGLAEENQGLSGALGAALPTAVRGAGKVIGGAVLDPAQELLKRSGVPMTPGQIAGGWTNRLEEGVGSIPFVGDAVNAARRRGIEGLNTAVAQRVMNPIGGEVAQAGRAGVQAAKTSVSNAYDEILPKLSFTPDVALGNAVTKVRDNLMKGAGGKNSAEIFDRILAGHQDRMVGGPISGEIYQAVRSDLGKQAKSLTTSATTADREAGLALRGVMREMESNLERGNPKFASELKNINEAYGNYKILSGASKRANELDEGVFTPAQLRMAVKDADISMGKDAFARGGAKMQDLAAAGERVLTNRLPDSGTATRSMIPAAIGAASYGAGVDPVIASLALAAPAVYSKSGIKALEALMTKRPDAARFIGDKISTNALPLSIGLLGGSQ